MQLCITNATKLHLRAVWRCPLFSAIKKKLIGACFTCSPRCQGRIPSCNDLLKGHRWFLSESGEGEHPERFE